MPYFRYEPSISKLYDVLAAKMGKETAENISSFFEEKIKDRMDNKSQVLATKDDVARIE